MTPEVALNLYSARVAMEQDLEGAIAGIADIGYRNVELAGYHGRSPEEFKRLLDANRLRAVSAHVPIARFANEMDTVIAEAKLLGLEALVVPWLSPEQRVPEFIDDLPVKLNEWGETVRSNRLRFAYHNHDFEYSIGFGERSLMEILLADTHPDFVDFEPDLYWIAEAGIDPVEQLLEMHPRVRMIHAKDRAADGSIANVGGGIFDWDAIIAASKRVMAAYLIVERDDPTDLMSDLGESYRFLETKLASV